MTPAEIFKAACRQNNVKALNDAFEVLSQMPAATVPRAALHLLKRRIELLLSTGNRKEYAEHGVDMSRAELPRDWQ